MALWAFLDSDSNDLVNILEQWAQRLVQWMLLNVFICDTECLSICNLYSNSNAKLINPILPSVQTSNLGGVLYEEILGKFFTTPLMTWTLL